MKIYKQILMLLMIIFISSCAKVFRSPDAYALAQNQKTIAIIPPTVAIPSNKGIDAEAMKEQQKTESINFQREMYSWLLKWKMKGKMNQDIQEPETTNAKLKKVGYPENLLTIEELCKELGVDGILTSHYNLSKPMTEGGAVAIAIFTGFWGTTNEVRISLSIHDCLNKKLIWNYDHKYSGGIGSNSSELVDDLMSDASRKMPYIK